MAGFGGRIKRFVLVEQDKAIVIAIKNEILSEAVLLEQELCIVKSLIRSNCCIYRLLESHGSDIEVRQ